MINEQPHFESNFFAANGTKSLNLLHCCAFDIYSSLIPKVLDGEMSIDDFIDKFEILIYVLPIIDPFHSQKIMDHKIK